VDQIASLAESSVDLGGLVARLTLNCTVYRAEFDPEPLLRCFPTSSAPVFDADCSAYTPVREPDGWLYFGSSKHESEDDTHHHVFFILELGGSDVPEDAPTWNDMLHRVGEYLQQDVRAVLNAEAFLPLAEWRTTLGLPRAATGMLPGLPEGAVSVSGVELDLSKTSLSVRRLGVSVRDKHMYVSIEYPRRLFVDGQTGSDLLREAVEITRLFVVKRESGEDQDG
jgi:hypothetical protein